MNGFISLKDTLERSRVYAGEVRHTLIHEKGEMENVALNNLLAIQSSVTMDVCGNKFMSQFYLPAEFYQRVNDKCASKGLFIEYLDEDEFGGKMGILSLATIQRYKGESIVVYVPFSDIVFEFDVTLNHLLKGKEEMGLEVGINKGFDLIVPFHPMLGYAPPRLLLEWAEQGYKSPMDVLDRIAIMGAEEKLQLIAGWEKNGWDDSRSLMLANNLAKPEEFLLLEEAKSEG